MTFLDYLQTRSFSESLVYVSSHLSGVIIGILIAVLVGIPVSTYIYSHGPATPARRLTDLSIRFLIAVISVIGCTLIIAKKIL